TLFPYTTLFRSVCAAAGKAIAKATPIPAATLPLPFVINSARWRMYRLCVERLAGAAMYRCRGTAHKGTALFRPRQEMMLQPHDVDERVRRTEVRQLHPAPAHAARHRTRTHRLPPLFRQAGRHGPLT